MLKRIKDFFKGISNLLKFSGGLLFIQILISFFSVIFLSENKSEWLTALSLLMLICSLVIMFFVSKSTAYYDFEVYKNNLIRRKRKDDVPQYRTMLEYRIYKGFIAGFITSLISIIFAVIGITSNAIVSESNIFGKIALVINFVYFVPVLQMGGPNSLYLVFCGSALTILSAGIGYMLSGERLKLQYNELQKGMQ